MAVGDWELLANPPTSKSLDNRTGLILEGVPDFGGVVFGAGGIPDLNSYLYTRGVGYSDLTDIPAQTHAYNFTGVVDGGLHVIQGPAGGTHRRLDLIAGTWSLCAAPPAGFTGSHFGVVCNDEIWFTDAENDWYIYTPATDTWRSVSNPRPLHGGQVVYHPALVARGDHIWLIGGQTTPGAFFTNRPWVDVYDTVGDSWSTMPDLEAANFNCYVAATVDADGRVFALAGINNVGAGTFKLQYLDEDGGVWVVVSTGGSWPPAGSDPVSARWAKMTTFGESVYIYDSRRTTNAVEFLRYEATAPIPPVIGRGSGSLAARTARIVA